MEERRGRGRRWVGRGEWKGQEEGGKEGVELYCFILQCLTSQLVVSSRDTVYKEIHEGAQKTALSLGARR